MLLCVCVCMSMQVKNLSLRLEQEIHKRSLSQSDLKMQTQQVSVLRSSEKQLKQELNHLLDMKQILEKQNQEIRRSNTHSHTISRVPAKQKGSPVCSILSVDCCGACHSSDGI